MAEAEQKVQDNLSGQHQDRAAFRTLQSQVAKLEFGEQRLQQQTAGMAEALEDMIRRKSPSVLWQLSQEAVSLPLSLNSPLRGHLQAQCSCFCIQTWQLYCVEMRSCQDLLAHWQQGSVSRPAVQKFASHLVWRFFASWVAIFVDRHAGFDFNTRHAARWHNMEELFHLVAYHLFIETDHHPPWVCRLSKTLQTG